LRDSSIRSAIFCTEEAEGPLSATEIRCGYAIGTCQRLQLLERATSTLFSVALRGPRASSVLKIPGPTTARQTNGETPGRDATTVRTVRGHSHRRTIVGPIGAENGGQSRCLTHCYKPLGDLVNRRFACLALQVADGRADPRLKIRDDRDTNGWTVPLPAILTRMGPSPTMTTGRRSAALAESVIPERRPIDRGTPASAWPGRIGRHS
jgi:hypothetical protein